MQKTQNNLLNNESQNLINELDLINVITDTITLDDDTKLELINTLHLFDLWQLYKIYKIIKNAECQLNEIEKNYSNNLFIIEKNNCYLN